MSRNVPDGAIAGICSASAIIASLSMGFLGNWAFANDSPFKYPEHLFIIAPGVVAFVFFGLAISAATKPSPDEQHSLALAGARRWFGLGILFVVGSLVAAFGTDWVA